MKFSGVISTSAGDSYMDDAFTDNSTHPLAYPISVASKAVNMAVNVLGGATFGAVTLTVQLLRNAVAVPGFSITYTGAQTGVKTVTAGPSSFAVGDTFDVLCNLSSGIGGGVEITATFGFQS